MPTSVGTPAAPFVPQGFLCLLPLLLQNTVRTTDKKRTAPISSCPAQRRRELVRRRRTTGKSAEGSLYSRPPRLHSPARSIGPSLLGALRPRSVSRMATKASRGEIGIGSEQSVSRQAIKYRPRESRATSPERWQSQHYYQN